MRKILLILSAAFTFVSCNNDAVMELKSDEKKSVKHKERDSFL
ncbi:hypothetical protein AB4865_01265 [Capnocytophaga sp. ARDL2]